MSNAAAKGQDSVDALRPLNNSWSIWVHLSHDTNWTLSSYTKLCKLSTLDEFVMLIKAIECLTNNCMIFIMKDDILPLWEDENNNGGGAISYKISDEHAVRFWYSLLFRILGGTFFESQVDSDRINGVTISPKKSFHIIKIWMKAGETIEKIAMNDNFGIAHEGQVYTQFNTDANGSGPASALASRGIGGRSPSVDGGSAPQFNLPQKRP